MNRSQDLAGLRTTFKRNSDGMRLFGWTTEFDSVGITIRTSTEEVMRFGEAFDFVVFGDRNCGVFRATFDKVFYYDPTQSKVTSLDVGSMVVIYETLLQFKFTSAVSYHSSSADARKLAHGIEGHLAVGGEKIPVQALDVSMGGAGLLSYVELSIDDPVELALNYGSSVSQIPATVRNCKPHPTIEGMFRLGVRFDQVGRIDQARLHSILDAA